MIFPEGVSQPEPTLKTLRTGAARLLLEAEATGAPPGDAPAGGHRRERARPLPGRPRAGADRRAGRRSTTAARSPRGDPVAAVRMLTDRLDRCAPASDRRGGGSRDPASAPGDRARVARGERHGAGAALGRVAAARVARLPVAAARPRRPRSRTSGARSRSTPTSSTSWACARRRSADSYAPSVVARYTAREVVPLLLGLPLAALGMLLHALPYQLLALGIRLARPDADTEATYKIAGGVVIYPLAWAFEAWLVHHFGGHRHGSSASCSCSAGWVLRARLAGPRSQNVAREARGLLHFLARRGLHERLVERRRALAEELERLAARVPRARAGRRAFVTMLAAVRGWSRRRRIAHPRRRGGGGRS